MNTRLTQEPQNKKPSVIRFQDSDYQLTINQLREQTGHKMKKGANWYPATLQFISFQNGHLHLINTCEQESHKLLLKMQQDGLYVTCDCSNNKQVFCEHIYGGLRTLIWDLGEDYFKKLLPDGAIPLAFKHPLYFNRCESRAGLNAWVREELKTVFVLDQKCTDTDLSLILKLLGEMPETSMPLIHTIESIAGEEGIAYLLMIPFQNRFQPFVVPCVGKLNKGQTGIKTFYGFLSAVEKTYDYLLTPAQKELNAACFTLWKQAENLPGKIIEDVLLECRPEQWLPVQRQWQKLVTHLAQQPFVFAYFLLRVEELKKGGPSKQKCMRIEIATDKPVIEFILTDHGAFYQLTLQVLISGEVIEEYEVGATFFIFHHKKMYLLASVKDVVIVQWMTQLDGAITVFKEHFARFEQSILEPIGQCYNITRRKASKNRKPVKR